MKQTNLLKKTLLLCALIVGSVSSVWATDETPGNTGSSNTAVSGTSYTIDGIYVSGKGNAQVTPMVTKGVKTRLNQSNQLVIAVNNGYKITAVTIYGVTNDSDKENAVTSLTVDGGSNLLAENITLPNKSAETAATISATGIEAKNNITLTFRNGSSDKNEAHFDYHFTYEARTDGYTASFNNGGHGTAPSTLSNATDVELPTLGADFYSNTGWTADKDVTVDEVTVSAGTTIACGKTATITEATTFTAQWEESDYPYVEGVTLPSLPSETFDLSTQTKYTPTNGYVVERAMTIRNGSNSWYSENSPGSASGQQWTAPDGSVFTSQTENINVMALMQTKKTYAMKFTGTTEFLALMNPRNNSRYVHALLVDYSAKTTTVRDITTTTGDNATPELTSGNIASFSGLNPTHTYVVFFYGYNDSGNGLLYEVAFRSTETVTTALAAGNRTYATHIAAADLDFTSVSEDVTAYIATGLNGTGTAVVIEAVEQVPANEPILIKTATEGATVNVPLATSTPADLNTNLFVKGDGSTTINTATDTDTYYYLANNQFHKATSGTLQTGKAYLKLEGVAPAAARALVMGFDDENGEITGIQSVNSEVKGLLDGDFYNIAGQRVAMPKKGLYIVNGKKIIIK